MTCIATKLRQLQEGDNTTLDARNLKAVAWIVDEDFNTKQCIYTFTDFSQIIVHPYNITFRTPSRFRGLTKCID